MKRYIDVTEMTDRAEELETEMQELAEAAGNEWNATDGGLAQFGDAVGADDIVAEAESLREILEGLKGQGGDHEWRGDWYPAQLIHADEFENAMDELLEDCGMMPRDIPAYLTVSVDYAALKMDYSEIEIDGETYYFR
jgi:hypothetical protein